MVNTLYGAAYIGRVALVLIACASAIFSHFGAPRAFIRLRLFVPIELALAFSETGPRHCPFNRNKPEPRQTASL